jgi:CHAT domain-containing protein
MVNLYNRLLGNGDPDKRESRADALRNAQLDLRKKYPDPYYWGAFVCLGDPRPLIRIG